MYTHMTSFRCSICCLGALPDVLAAFPIALHYRRESGPATQGAASSPTQDSSKGVQWKQGVVVYIILCVVLLYGTTPIHCTPLPLHPPLQSIQTTEGAASSPVVYFNVEIHISNTSCRIITMLT